MNRDEIEIRFDEWQLDDQKMTMDWSIMNDQVPAFTA